MTLIYQDALLAGDVLDNESGIYGQRANADNPIVCYKNFLTASMVSADSSQENHSIARALVDSTSEKWKSDSLAVQNIDLDLSSVNKGHTAFCVAAHNLAGAYVRLLVSATQGSGYSVLIPTIYVETNRPLMFCFEDPSNADFFRFEITPFYDKPVIGYLFLGQFEQLQRRIYVGHSPIVFGRKNEYYTPKTANGNFPGRIKKSTKLEGMLKQKDVTPDYYRAQVDPFLLAIEGTPFFFAWRPQTYSSETALCWTKGNVMPTNTRPNGWMDYQIGLEAHNPSSISEAVLNHVPGTISFTDYGLDLSGSEKSYHSVYASNQKIYVTPSQVSWTLVIDTQTQQAEKKYFGSSGSNRFWWSVYAPNQEKIYQIPMDSNVVAIIDTTDDTSVTTNFGLSMSSGDKFSTAAVAPNEKIYCAPFNAGTCLIIDTTNDTGVYNDFGLTFPSGSFYDDPIMAANGNLYFWSRALQPFLCINTNNDTATLQDFGLSISGHFISRGVLDSAGYLYYYNNTTSQVIRVNTANNVGSFETYSLALSGRDFDTCFYDQATDRIMFFPNGFGDDILVINATAQTAYFVNIPWPGGYNTQRFYDAVPVRAPSGSIYLLPQTNTDGLIVVFNPSTSAVSFINALDDPNNQGYQWQLLAPARREIYLLPHSSSAEVGILKV